MTTTTDKPLFRDTAFQPAEHYYLLINLKASISQATRNWTTVEIAAMAETMAKMVIETTNTYAVMPCALVQEDDASCDLELVMYADLSGPQFRSVPPGWASQDEFDRYIDRLNAKEHGPVEHEAEPSSLGSVLVVTFVYRKHGKPVELIISEVFRNEDDLLAWVEDEYPDMLDSTRCALRDGDPIEENNVVMQINRRPVIGRHGI